MLHKKQLNNPVSKKEGSYKKLYTTKEGKEVDLLNSLLFNPRLLQSKESNNYYDISTFAKRFVEVHYMDHKKKMMQTRITALNNIVSNVFKAYLQHKVVAIGKSPSYYSGNKFYGIDHFTFSVMSDALNKLEQNGYIECANGFYQSDADGKESAGYRSRIWTTGKLIDAVSITKDESLSCNVTKRFEFIETDQSLTIPLFTETKYTNPIVLKDGSKAKKPISYLPNKDTSRMYERISAYNNLMDKHRVTIPLELNCEIASLAKKDNCCIDSMHYLTKEDSFNVTAR